MSYDQTQVAFVDTETTGLDPDFHHPWEIAVIVDGVEHCWLHYLTPSQLQCTDPWVLEHTGINERYHPEQALDPADSIRKFTELVKGRHLVGACPWFDSERLHKVHRNSLSSYVWTELQAVPLINPDRAHPWHHHLIDIEALAVGYLLGIYQECEPDGLGAGGPGYQLLKAGLPWSSEDLSRAIHIDPDDFAPKHTALTDARWAKAMFEAIFGGPK